MIRFTDEQIAQMTAGIFGIALLMVLPGFVIFIVGDIANILIPDKKGGES